ncbi:MAG: pyruvate kinase [Candidatus Helarchaeota archaeon]
MIITRYSLFKKTKIIATVGPASFKKEVLEKIIEKADIIRLNFSFGDHDFYTKLIEQIRDISSKNSRNVAILQDIQGPKIRISKIKNGKLELKSNDTLIIKSNTDHLLDDEISITYNGLYKDVKPGDKILISDGIIELEVNKIKDNNIITSVIQGGLLKEKKGLNVPIKLDIPTITQKDYNDIIFGIQQNMDYIALSFVRSPSDIIELRKIIEKNKKSHEDGNTPGIVAKIERPEALNEIEKIIELSDAIMVARGDLGIELPLEKIPKIQHNIIKYCLKLSKPVIIATQLLYSMVNTARPTRAEVADVYNSVLGGADCLMLSDETASGKYPIKSIEIFNKIIIEAEKDLIPIQLFFRSEKHESFDPAHAVANAACELANDLKAKAIVSFTKSGFTALLISKNRPNANIIGITPNKSVLGKLALFWGVIAKYYPNIKTTDEIINISEKCVLDEGLAKKGDIIIITAGIPFGFSGITNLIKVHKIDSHN